MGSLKDLLGQVWRRRRNVRVRSSKVEEQPQVRMPCARTAAESVRAVGGRRMTMAQGYMAWRGGTAGRAVAARTAWRPASDAIEGDEVAVSECLRHPHTNGPGPAPTDGAGVLPSSLARGELETR
eukprot:scaffold4498_cov119-Isochrysis_galbana.AAC.1